MRLLSVCPTEGRDERLLYEALENRPNPETMEAIEEARSAKDKETFDSVESLMNELMK